MKTNNYFYNVIIGVDQLANALLGGYCEETLFFVRFLFNLINLIMLNRDHCFDCIEWGIKTEIEKSEPWRWYKGGYFDYKD